MKKSDKDSKDFITKNGLCFGCLHRGHVTKDCKRKRNCRICKGMHHTVLHRYSVIKDEAQSSSSTKIGEC